MAKLTDTKTRKYWKTKGTANKAKMIPLDEMSDEHLQKVYFVSQNKELEFMNKSLKFAEVGEDIEEEAKKRGITLRSIENEPGHNIGDYFANNRKLKQ